MIDQEQPSGLRASSANSCIPVTPNCLPRWERLEYIVIRVCGGAFASARRALPIGYVPDVPAARALASWEGFSRPFILIVFPLRKLMTTLVVEPTF